MRVYSASLSPPTLSFSPSLSLSLYLLFLSSVASWRDRGRVCAFCVSFYLCLSDIFLVFSCLLEGWIKSACILIFFLSLSSYLSFSPYLSLSLSLTSLSFSCQLEGWSKSVCVLRLHEASVGYPSMPHLLLSIAEQICLLTGHPLSPLLQQVRQEAWLIDFMFEQFEQFIDKQYVHIGL